MDSAFLGRTGLRVSRLCLGCMTYGSTQWRPWVLDEEVGRHFIRDAFNAGINFFDTADMYSRGVSEEILGRALNDVARRNEVVIATKVFSPMSDALNDRGLSRKHIMESIDRSLRRLGTDYVDLYQIHRWDPKTPIEETLEALDDVVRAGKALYLGASSMHAWQFMKALALQQRHGWARFVSMQNHYNLLYREEEREMLPLCLSEGVGVIPWSPLARGRLARPVGENTHRADTDDFGKTLYGAPADDAVIDAVAGVAAERGVTMAQVALAWVLSRPGVVAPIVGVSKPHHLSDAVGALALSLDDGEIERLEEAYQPQPVRGHT
ncbi:MAG: aldo/keto reductase [Rhodospirillales bacterium]|nr:aldo/keto reductase [Rhodospirillales bacterium]